MKIFLPLLTFLPLTFFELFVGKSDRTGCTFTTLILAHHIFNFFEKIGKSSKNIFHEKSGIICINYLIMQDAIVIWKTKMAALKYRQQENESGFWYK